MMDDVLIHAMTREEHDKRLKQVLGHLEGLGMTLNSEICQFAQSSGIRPDSSKVSAIRNVPAPENMGDVRCFLGMVNQPSKFAPHLAEMTKPLREILVNDNAWVWEDAQRIAFTPIKETLMAAPIFSLFDPNLETNVADASSFGLGAVLKQRQRSGELKSVAFISRAMTPIDRRHAQIEKETLVFTWTCEQLSNYLTGLHFHIEMDHKPLVLLFSTKNLEELPLQVQRFRLQMMRYSLKTVSDRRYTVAGSTL